MPENRIDREVRAHYASVRKSLPGTGRVAVLHIAPAHVALALGELAAPERVWVLPLGSLAISEKYFKHSPPTPLELENAIVIVEDAIAQARAIVGSKARLVTTDAVIHAIAVHSGVAENASMVMSRGAVEASFARVAAVAEGLPPSSAGLPLDAEFLASLLILRECMHHLNFAEIVCVNP